MSVLAITAWLAACSAPDPELVSARTYVSAMEPLLEDNQAIAREFLSAAEQIQAGDAGADSARARLADHVLPPARQLATDVAVVKAPSADLEPVHAKLVTAWDARADAYEALLKAYDAKDLAGFDKALAADLAVKTTEDRWLHDTNELLVPKGLRLTLLP